MVYRAPVDSCVPRFDDASMDIESKIAVLDAEIRATYVTKEDLLKAINTLTWKMYGFGTLLVAVVFFIAKNVD